MPHELGSAQVMSEFKPTTFSLREFSLRLPNPSQVTSRDSIYILGILFAAVSVAFSVDRSSFPSFNS